MNHCWNAVIDVSNIPFSHSNDIDVYFIWVLITLLSSVSASRSSHNRPGSNLCSTKQHIVFHTFCAHARLAHLIPEMQVHWTVFNVDVLQRGTLEYSNSSVWCPCSSSRQSLAWVLPFCIQGSDTTAATEVFALTEESCISFVADLEINFKHLQTFWRFLIEWKRARFIRFDLKTRIAMPQFEHFLCDSVKSERWPWLLQSPLWLSSRGDTMISCRKHATNDDILLTVAQHSNQTAVLAFTDINMCNRRIYEQQVVWNGITWYWYCVMQADQASKIDGPTKISQILQLKASNESCRMEHDRTAS